jgi:phospholipid/cholesterol/gamma-HCH transport system substrate-binding protein
MKKRLEIELKVGLFVTIGVVLTMVAILVLGSAENITQRHNHYTTHLATADGLISGAKVMMSGIHVGTIDTLIFDGDKREVSINFTVDRNSSEWIRKDSAAEVLSQGVLGDKYLSIIPGTEASPKLEENGDIPLHPSKDLTQFLSKGDQLLMTLNSIATDLNHVMKTFDANNRSEILFSGMAATAKNMSEASAKLNNQLDGMALKSAIKNLNAILEKVNNGTGTLGALINDPGLYDNARALVGGANRNRILRNLVRETVEKGNQEPESAAPAK